MNRLIRVLVADDEPQMRAVISDLILDEDGMELVGMAGDADEAAKLADELQPDVALLDVKMPEGGGPFAAQEIRRVSPGTRIIALSAYNDRGAIVEMLRAGATGYLLKDGSIDAIVDSIRGISDSTSYLSAEVANSLIDELVGRVDVEVKETELHEAALSRIEGVLDDPTVVTMHFQPIVDLETRRPIGMEALARFSAEPSRTPDRWFAEADQVGLGDELEILALESAFASLSQLAPPLFMSVNISPRAARSEAFAETMDLVRPDRVVIEMTEHAPISDYDAITESLQRQRARGVRLAIDDAGAGFSSLQHILNMDPDVIKLDISMTRDIESTPPKRALAAALSTFAHEIGCLMVAEGIETEEEVEVLCELGISVGQGYLLGVPAPLDERRPV